MLKISEFKAVVMSIKDEVRGKMVSYRLVKIKQQSVFLMPVLITF